MIMNKPQTNSRIITWGGYLGLTLLLALPLSVLMVRSGIWQQGLLLYALSCAGATLLLLVFIILLLIPGFKASRAGLINRGLLLLPGCLLFLSLLSGRGDYPPIHDISTDTLDPPVFITAQAQRGKHANPLTIKPESIEQQRQFYPKLTTLRNRDSFAENFERALTTVEALGWEVYHSDADSGIIEAVDTTAIMAFKDDVVIRLRTDGDTSLIDLRSVSRVGIGDIGANAKRIVAFQKQFRQ
jgi:uncharacterized protein (DUF1499 family)